MEARVPLSVAAMRLGLDYQQCRKRLLSGQLAGGRDEFGRWYVLEAALARSVAGARSDAPKPRRARRATPDAAA